MKVRQAVITKPFEAEVREVNLPDPADNQILIETEVSAISPGTGAPSGRPTQTPMVRVPSNPTAQASR